MIKEILVPLGQFFESNIGAIVKTGLSAAGVGVISYAAISAAFDIALNYARSQFDSLATDALQLIGLAGIGEALGLIAGALAFRVTFTSMSKLGVLPK
ncbi:Protein of unknown function [Nitrosomonas aestuarii]|uniref:DUF2523 domain-containing protein n=1 Tax=Nitrosomonas aestuarii TaxID=52441 RepID=A0A1I3YHS8_9PROT|nr:DUF2523 domain-containing protein [Nitrosomonas aestuarii]SFK31477.1 Protein of unknown function [Nitrosomonas aestuarii]